MDGNKEVLKKYEDVKEGVNGGEKIEYGKDFSKIRFEIFLYDALYELV